MTTSRRPLSLALAGLALSLSTSARAADTQTVDCGGLTFEAPAAWKSQKPESQMRRAQLEIAAAKGDEDPAKLIVFAFPGGAGSVDANVERWQRQFRDKDGNPPKPDVTKVKGKNVEATRVELAGHYYPANFPGQKKEPDRENYRLVAGIVVGADTSYFIRLVGPEKTIAETKAEFDKLLASLKADEK